MIGLEVLVNGKRALLAGREHLSVLRADVVFYGVLGSESRGTRLLKDGYRGRLSGSGMSSFRADNSYENLLWDPKISLTKFDVVEIRVVDVEETDLPTRASTSPARDSEPFSTDGLDEHDQLEMFRAARRVYLALRETFEGLPLTRDEEELVAQLDAAQLEEIDSVILANVGDRWRKVAMVVGKTMRQLEHEYRGIPNTFYAQRIRELVHTGLLESQGDLEFIRFSEVRRPSGRKD